MGGIEFYPQKEFDDDMEDKSDNDKIRVSGSVLSFTYICPAIFLLFQSLSRPSSPPSLSQSLPRLRTASSKQNVRALGHVVYLFHLIKPCAALFGTLNRVEMSLSIGGDALCRGGQRQRISSEWQTSSGEEDSMGNRRRWVIWPFLISNIYSLFATEIISMISGKGLDI